MESDRKSFYDYLYSLPKDILIETLRLEITRRYTFALTRRSGHEYMHVGVRKPGGISEKMLCINFQCDNGRQTSIPEMRKLSAIFRGNVAYDGNKITITVWGPAYYVNYQITIETRHEKTYLIFSRSADLEFLLPVEECDLESLADVFDCCMKIAETRRSYIREKDAEKEVEKVFLAYVQGKGYNQEDKDDPEDAGEYDYDLDEGDIIIYQ